MNEQPTKHRYRLIILVFILIILSFFTWCFIFINNQEELNIQQIKTENQKNEPEDTSNKNIEARLNSIYLEIRDNAIADTNDPNFTKYVKETLDITCPFYEPNGVDYRSCLGTFVENQKTKMGENKDKLTKIEDYCSELGSKYAPGVGQMDIYF